MQPKAKARAIPAEAIGVGAKVQSKVLGAEGLPAGRRCRAVGRKRTHGSGPSSKDG